MRHVQVAAEKIQNLLALPGKTFVITVRSHFLCDENSVPISQDFTLLDLQVLKTRRVQLDQNQPGVGGAQVESL